jgi:hypothetical protein
MAEPGAFLSKLAVEQRASAAIHVLTAPLECFASTPLGNGRGSSGAIHVRAVRVSCLTPNEINVSKALRTSPTAEAWIMPPGLSRHEWMSSLAACQ